MKLCPFCAEEIQDAAIVCKHCGRDLAQATATATVAATPAKGGGRATALVVLLGILGAFVLLVIVFSGGTNTPTLTPAMQTQVMDNLTAAGIPLPESLSVSGAGFVVADYRVPDTVRTPRHQANGERYLLTIREILLPHGFKDYRVNIFGPPPGTGLVRRIGAARYIDGGKLEWLTE